MSAVINRRNLIVGLIAAPALAPIAGALTVEQQSALAPIVAAVRSSLGGLFYEKAMMALAALVRHSIVSTAHDSSDSLVDDYASLSRWAEPHADIERMILEELSAMVTRARAEGNHLVDGYGLTLSAQLEVTERFPWVPMDWPKEVWDALVSLIPDDLICGSERKPRGDWTMEWDRMPDGSVRNVIITVS